MFWIFSLGLGFGAALMMLPKAVAHLHAAGHDHHLHAVWVNTELNLKDGRVQYVYVIPDVLVTVITLNLKPDGNQTLVEVRYHRTALIPEADAHVQEMAKQDHDAGPEWQTQINQYLEKHPGS